jgi:hypothetical protein
MFPESCQMFPESCQMFPESCRMIPESCKLSLSISFTKWKGKTILVQLVNNNIRLVNNNIGLVSMLILTNNIGSI